MGIRLGSLERTHRDSLRDLLVATDFFSSEEVDVALELFDEGLRSGRGSGRPESDYEFLACFSESSALLGFACYGPTPSTEGTYDLYWIAVHPESQGTGAGTRLLAAVEQQMSERRARLLVVETSSRERYAPTRRFYERRGYAPSARIRDFYSPGDDRVIYTKHFHGPLPSIEAE
jgi:ribosomal protein S18 acetylase RimI-like enzyme